MRLYKTFKTLSEKDAPLAEFLTHDGTQHFNLDEMFRAIKEDYFCLQDEPLVYLYIDTDIHEDIHKAISEAVMDQETFNEQDERVFMVMRDWIYNSKQTSIVQYDW